MAQELSGHGWKSVHPLYGGYDAWERAGLPVEPKWVETKDFEIKG